MIATRLPLLASEHCEYDPKFPWLVLVLCSSWGRWQTCKKKKRQRVKRYTVDLSRALSVFLSCMLIQYLSPSLLLSVNGSSTFYATPHYLPSIDLGPAMHQMTRVFYTWQLYSYSTFDQDTGLPTSHESLERSLVLVLLSPGEDHAQIINALYIMRWIVVIGCQSTSVGEDSRTSAFELLMLDNAGHLWTVVLCTFIKFH